MPQYPQDLKIYSVATTDNTPSHWLDADRDVERLVHASRMPGGYFELSFETAVSQDEFKKWLVDRLDFRITLSQGAAERLFEGRVSEVLPIGLENAVRVTAQGYFNNFKDGVYQATTAGAAVYSKSYAAQRPDQIITNILASGFNADGLQLSTATNRLSTAGRSITQAYDNSWDYWRVLTDPNFGAVNFGTTANERLDIAVWEDRVVHLTVRGSTGVNAPDSWHSFISSDIGGGVASFPAKTSLNKLRNSVTSIYNDTFTSVSSDEASINKYHRIEHVAMVTSSTDQGTAEARRDVDLEEGKDLLPETDALTLNRVWDANGVEKPLCSVRAGDTLIIPDFLSPLILSQSSFNATRVFFIEEATCDHANGTLRIRPNTDAGSLGSLLAKNSIISKR